MLEVLIPSITAKKHHAKLTILTTYQNKWALRVYNNIVLLMKWKEGQEHLEPAKTVLMCDFAAPIHNMFKP
jgi:hypothetical protein